MEQKKKKILFVITKSNWGGAGRYVYDLATTLPKSEFDVVVALGGTGLRNAKEGRLAELLAEHSIRTIYVKNFSRDINIFSDIRSFFELWSIFKKEHPTIVHLNSSKAGGVGALAARFTGIAKIIFTAHGWPFWEKRSLPSRAAIWFFSWLTSVFSHTTICISHYDLHVAQQMPFVFHKAVLVRNGIDPIDFIVGERNDSQLRVLTNGELNDNKNLFVGIDAVAKARILGAHISYSIMSDGELRGALERYVADKKYGDFVHFLGFVPDGKRHYKDFDIFFLPSKKEGVPYVLLEAGLAALPVVASNVGGIPEIIENKKNGLLFASSDITGFAQALYELAGSAEERSRLGSALEKKVERDFSIEQMVEKTLSIYRG